MQAATIKSLQESLDESVALQKQAKKRALEAEQESRAAQAALREQVRSMYPASKGTLHIEADEQPAAERKRPVAAVWAQRLRKRLRLR